MGGPASASRGSRLRGARTRDAAPRLPTVPAGLSPPGYRGTRHRPTPPPYQTIGPPAQPRGRDFPVPCATLCARRPPPAPRIPGARLPGRLTAPAGRDRARIRRRRGPADGRPALTLEWLDGCGLVKPLDEGELAYSPGVLVEEVAELLRD